MESPFVNITIRSTCGLVASCCICCISFALATLSLPGPQWADRWQHPVRCARIGQGFVRELLSISSWPDPFYTWAWHSMAVAFSCSLYLSHDRSFGHGISSIMWLCKYDQMHARAAICGVFLFILGAVYNSLRFAFILYAAVPFSGAWPTRSGGCPTWGCPGVMCFERKLMKVTKVITIVLWLCEFFRTEGQHQGTLVMISILKIRISEPHTDIRVQKTAHDWKGIELSQQETSNSVVAGSKVQKKT